MLDHCAALLLAPQRLLWHRKTELPWSPRLRDSAGYETLELASVAVMNSMCSGTLHQAPCEASWLAARMTQRRSAVALETLRCLSAESAFYLVESSRQIIFSRNAYIGV